MSHVFLSAGSQPSALMGLIQCSDYECLQQALGPDWKSALSYDFLMFLHVNRAAGIDSAMCRLFCSRIITWTEIICHKMRCRLLSFICSICVYRHKVRQQVSEALATLRQIKLKKRFLSKLLRITKASSSFPFLIV